MADEQSFYCDKCKRTMGKSQFYTSNNLTKYPNGVMTQCKKCMSMHVDNWDPDTYLWILQEADVPYAPWEWNSLLAKYAKNASKVTGMTILGRYLSKMRLKQYKDDRWADSEFIQQQHEAKIRETMQRQGYDKQEIAEVIKTGTFQMPDKPLEEPEAPVSADQVGQAPIAQQQDLDFEVDITDEDREYLRLKWGPYYKPYEWVQMEQLFTDMMNSYDIHEAGHVDTLKLICKTSLKANQLIDIGDIEGYQKLSKVYNDLMKSGNFTAAQNKSDNGEFVNAVSELVLLCEKDGFIPQYYVDGPQDKVDRTIEDMQRYTKTLVMDEMGLGQMIENSLKQIEADRKKELEERDKESEEPLSEDDEIFNYDAPPELTEDDYVELKELEEQLEAEDDKLYQQIAEGKRV